MDLKIQVKTGDLILKLIGKKPFEQAVPFSVQKEEFPRGMELSEQPLPRKAPEETGVNSAHIEKFLKELENESGINVHQCFIVKDGAVISESAMYPYQTNIWHVGHSLCKTLTGLAVGILATEGKLDLEEKIVKLFDKQMNALQKLRLGKITVRELLNMSSGLIISEIVLCAEPDWLKACLDSGTNFEPGSKFAYNTMNSYLLSCIVQDISGMTLLDFLKEKLLSKMGIKTICWESCPMGRTKGGWGLYMLPEDMAKIAVFILNRGKWQDEQIISEEYMDTMCSKQMETPEDDGLGYGYQVWMGKREGSCLLNGMFGQNVHCMPDLSMVIAVTGGNDKLFGNCRTNDIIYKYFGEGFTPSGSLPANSEALESLRKTESSLRSITADEILKTIKQEEKLPEKKLNFWERLFAKKEPAADTIKTLPSECDEISGKRYTMDKKFIRLLPLFTALMDNCYTEGIEEMGFYRDRENFYLVVREGKETNHIKIGFDGNYCYSTVTACGEPFTVAASGAFAKDEDGNTVLKLSLPFTEHSNSRSLKIYFLPGDRIRTRWWEFPGKSVIEDGAKSMISSMSDTVLSQIKSRYDLDLLIELAGGLTEPVCDASLTK